MKRLLVLAMMLGSLFSRTLAQDKLSDEEITITKQLMQNNPRCTNHMLWFESQNALNNYLSTIPGRCPEEVEWVQQRAADWHHSNSMIVRLEKQIYPKPGSKKSEKNLMAHFTNVEQAKQTFQCAREAESMYEQFMKQTAGFVEARRNATYKAPEGELTYFSYHQGGGMMRTPPISATLQKMKDGTYQAIMSTDEFDQYDTLAISLDQVKEIRQMLIEGEVYKMPQYYDSPILILDAPHSNVSVRFSDASYSCNNFPPSDWGGKNILAVFNYLKALQPKHEKMERMER